MFGVRSPLLATVLSELFIKGSKGRTGPVAQWMSYGIKVVGIGFAPPYQIQSTASL